MHRCSLWLDARLNRWQLTAFGLFAVLALASTWPLGRYTQSGLALGSEPAPTVPLLNAWTIWWNCDRLAHLYADYWDAPIFFPAKMTFALSEPLPLTSLTAPAAWRNGQLILVANLLLLGALTLNGWFVFRVVFEAGYSYAAAIAGGGMAVLLPFVHQELGVFQLTWVCGVVWVIASLQRLARGPNGKTASILGASFAFTYLMCAYYGLFLLPVLASSGGWLISGRGRPREVIPWLVVAVAVAAILIMPIVLGQMGAIREHDMHRSPEQQRLLSANPSSYLESPWKYRLPLPELIRQGSCAFPLSPGITKCGLAVVGIAGGLCMSQHRRWTAFCVTFLIVSFALSLGPNLSVGHFAPYEYLARLPGFAQARSVFRFGMFVQLAVVLLAAGGLQSLWRGVDAWCRQRVRLRLLARAMILALGLAGLIELWPPAQRIFFVPPVANTAWVEWLRDHTNQSCVIAHLPMPQGDDVQDYEPTAIHMYAQTIHQRRMLNGYSGFLPAVYLKAQSQLLRFPEPASLIALRDCGVDYCVVDDRAVSQPEITAGQIASPTRLILAFRDGQQDITIYRVDRTSSVPGDSNPVIVLCSRFVQ